MNSALLRTTIKIYELVTSTTEYGHIKNSYELKYKTKAHVIFNSENQVVSEGEVFYPISKTFVVRAYVPVVETDRIECENKMWKILSINKNEYYNNTECQCTLVND